MASTSKALNLSLCWINYRLGDLRTATFSLSLRTGVTCSFVYSGNNGLWPISWIWGRPRAQCELGSFGKRHTNVNAIDINLSRHFSSKSIYIIRENSEQTSSGEISVLSCKAMLSAQCSDVLLTISMIIVSIKAITGGSEYRAIISTCSHGGL